MLNLLLFVRTPGLRWRAGRRSWLLPALALLLGGCASDKGLISHSFYNIAARDNAYFLAREKLRAVEITLFKGRVNDYNAVLPLFPTLDSTAVQANRAELNDIIKKASVPIQHRPGSDWTDNAYLLVAWARFFKMEFDDAALTFKYVNTTSKDANARHEALIGLMRTFVATRQLESAKAVSDLLDKEAGRPEDARELFLTRADYFLKTDNLAQAIAQLERAVPLIPLKNERSRTRFVLAQLYQQAGDDKKAYAQLNEILKRNPPYELDLQSKLLLGQVSELGSQDQARLDKYFAALLKDSKNKEYRDKIYYEMARVAYRKQQYPAALALLNTSARLPARGTSQKSYTYLLSGRIYYENLRKYRLAAAYYDSTVQSLSKNAPTYAAVRERSEILSEFAKQYTIIETQDSLQALVRLTPEVREARLTAYAAAEVEAKKKAAERQAVLAKERARADELAGRSSSSDAGGGIGGGIGGGFGSRGAGGGARPGNPAPGQQNIADPTALASAGPGGVFYFDNPGALGTARADFQRRWGNRPLQDNWRTNTQRVATPGSSPPGAQPGAPLAGSPDAGAAGGAAGQPGAAPEAPVLSPEAVQSALVAQYKQALPDTPDKLLASNTQVEAATYALGTIYKEQLKEAERSYETYAGQVARFPRGAHAPDAYYLLYLHYRDLPDAAKTAEYAAALQREFPASIYAKLIRDPQYREHELALHNAVASRVDSAFTFYKNQDFRKARTVLARTEAAYPVSDLSDRVAYLKTLLTIRTQAPPKARAAVEGFTQKYPASPLVPQAQALAATYQKYEAKGINGVLTATDTPPVSIFRPGEVDNRMRIEYAPAAPAPAAAEPAVTPAAPAPGTPAPGAPATTSAPKGGRAGQPTNPAAATVSPQAVPGNPTPVPGGAAPAAGAASAPSLAASPGGTPATAPASGAASSPTLADAPAAPPAAPTTAYTTQLSAMHAVVLVFAKGTPAAAELPTQFAAYHARYFRDSNLQLQAQPLDGSQELLIVRALPGAKVAQGYASKLRGPQSPVAKLLRGPGYQTLVVSIENLNLLLSSGDLAGYLNFYARTYK